MTRKRSRRGGLYRPELERELTKLDREFQKTESIQRLVEIAEEKEALLARFHRTMQGFYRPGRQRTE